MILCDRCGRPARRRVFHDNSFWCTPCFETRTHVHAVHADGIPGGLTLENYGPNPVTFYSHSEREAYMQRHGLQLKEKFSPLPGTDIDPAGIPNPTGYVDPQTALNVQALLERRFKVGVPYGGEPQVPQVTDDVLVNVRAETWPGQDVKELMEKIK